MKKTKTRSPHNIIADIRWAKQQVERQRQLIRLWQNHIDTAEKTVRELRETIAACFQEIENLTEP